MQDIRYIELRISGEAMAEELFAQMAASQGCTGTALETDADSGAEQHVAWFEAREDEKEQRAQLAAAALLAGAKPEQITLKVLGDDWETAWQEHWKPMPIGERLWVRPSFCDAPSDDRIDIVLDPGMAFGTGQHPTTCLCLRAIERYCENGAPQSLLDMGAGSGLLAIAAGKFGAKGIVAIDYDPISVEATAVNAEINGVELESLLGDTPPEQKFELVVANILAGPLIEMAQGLADCTERHLILSGLLETQVESIVQAYEAAGLKKLRVDVQGEWASVELIRA